MNISVKSLDNDKIVLRMKGANVNFSTVNTLRRIILSEIPTYAIPPSNIYIEKNSSVFDNDQMKTRIGMLPIPKLSNNIEYFHKDDKYEQDQVDVYLNAVNNTPYIINVTTNDYTIFVNGEEIENLYDQEQPNLVVKLRPQEEFKFRATAQLGKAKINDLWAAASPVFYKELADDDYEFTFETLGQLTHKEILLKACTVVIKKLEEIEVMIGDNYNDSSLDKVKKVHLTLEHEDHTMGNLITTALQDNPSVSYAGFKKDHLLIDEIVLRIETTNPNPLKNFFEIITKLKGMFAKTRSDIEKLDIGSSSSKSKSKSTSK